MHKSQEVEISAKNGYKEVKVQIELPHKDHWVDDGWTWDSDAEKMYTVTTCKPSPLPPRNPAGLATASADAVQR